MGRDRIANQLRDGILLRGIGCQRGGAAAFCLDHAYGFGRGVEVAIHGDHPRAFPREQDGGSPAVADRVTRGLTRADHEGHFVGEAIAHGLGNPSHRPASGAPSRTRKSFASTRRLYSASDRDGAVDFLARNRGNFFLLGDFEILEITPP